MTTAFSAHTFLGMCHECLQVKVFDTERARDLWEKFHPHEGGEWE